MFWQLLSMYKHEGLRNALFLSRRENVTQSKPNANDFHVQKTKPRMIIDVELQSDLLKCVFRFCIVLKHTPSLSSWSLFRAFSILHRLHVYQTQLLVVPVCRFLCFSARYEKPEQVSKQNTSEACLIISGCLP